MSRRDPPPSQPPPSGADGPASRYGFSSRSGSAPRWLPWACGVLCLVVVLLAASLQLPPDPAAAAQQARDQMAVVQAVLVVLAVLPLAMALRLRRQRREVREALSQFSEELGSGDWQGAVQTLRNEPQGPPSAFDALATGVAGVMGETDRRWQALADL